MDEEDILNNLDLLGPQPLSSEEVWLSMWRAIASNSSVSSPIIASNWADQGLADFIERFGPDDDEGEMEGGSYDNVQTH